MLAYSKRMEVMSVMAGWRRTVKLSKDPPASLMRLSITSIDGLKDIVGKLCVFCWLLYTGRAKMSKLVLTTPHLALFVARRNSGKSHLAKFLLYTLARAQRFKWVLCICNTSFVGDWGAIIGEENVLPVFDGEQLEILM